MKCQWLVTVVVLWFAVVEAAVCPLVIAHRGASGDRPEHTLEAYALAIDQGADFIEPDLVPTKDGVLIARHESALAIVALDESGKILRESSQPTLIEATTNVATKAEFTDRLTVKIIDGKRIGGWFSEDFTLAEIQTLRARERLPALRTANTAFDDQFRVPTFGDVLKLALSRGVGVYPELKHYTYFMNEAIDVNGLAVRHDTVNLLLRDLSRAQFHDPSKLFIQSFEVEPLKRLRGIATAGDSAAFPLVQLTGPPTTQPYDVVAQRGSTTYGELLSNPAALKLSHADAVGPAYQALLADPGMVKSLHAAGLKVHPFTVRMETQFLPKDETFESLLRRLMALKVDGLFTDHPAAAKAELRDCSTVD